MNQLLICLTTTKGESHTVNLSKVQEYFSLNEAFTRIIFKEDDYIDTYVKKEDLDKALFNFTTLVNLER